MKWMLVLVVVVWFLVVAEAAYAVEVSAAEMCEQRRWLTAVFPSLAPAAPARPEAGLALEFNHDWVQHNAFCGAPLRVGGKVYYEGLMCHAPSKIRVQLPAPGKTFSAVVGVDTNQFSAGGKGSIVFSVAVGHEERFRSGIMREGMTGVPVTVDLAGAREVVIAVEDAGDNIASDLAAWAEARVELEDGQVLRLGEMPIIEGQDGVEYGPGPPFSFTYDGKASAELLPMWQATQDLEPLDDTRVRHVLSYADPDTGLEVRCEMIRYLDFPTLEWTLFFKNNGGAPTPILKDVHGLDATIQRYPFPHPPVGEFMLHLNRGDSCGPSSYEPLTELLEPGRQFSLAPQGGRPTNGQFPYFNIEWLSEGVIIALGWPGQWAAHFARDDDTGLRVRGGQELTHLSLHPGEEIRTPLVVVQFWKGDWVRAQNLWRRWMMAHSMPKPGGELPKPQVLGSSYRVYNEMVNATEENQLLFINRYIEEDIKIDYWWMDAGWYLGAHQRGWPAVGTWEIDRERFPNGFKAISDYAHSKGIKILVWFEPERVAPDTWLTENHPEWILGGANGGLLNLGDPDARTWLTEHVDKLLTDQGIDLYRQDFNMDPLGHWRGNDTEDRQGLTEIRHVTGYLAYWDALIRRHPDMLIDSCASGGRRNDLETLRRAVPLWRSDYGYEPLGNQCQTYGLALWIPYFGAGNLASAEGYYGEGRTPVHPYAFWSTCYPSINSAVDMRVQDNHYDARRELLRQRERIVEDFYGDFYPLTPHSLAGDVWVGWQFHRPERGTGFIQMFRRADSPFEVGSWPLRALEPRARYRIEDLRTGETREATGDELMHHGARLSIPERPGAAVVLYERIGAGS